MVTLVDSDRLWFMSRVGIDARLVPRDHATRGQRHRSQLATLVVSDAHLDPRFRDAPLVQGPPHIRFYAGRPLRSRHGLVLGTLSLVDPAARAFGSDDIEALDDLADMAQAHLRALEAAAEAQAAKSSLERSELLFARAMAHAAVGIAVATPDGRWLEMTSAFARSSDIRASAGSARWRRISCTGTTSTPAPDCCVRCWKGKPNPSTWRCASCGPMAVPRGPQVGASALVDAQGRPENLVTVLTDINTRKRFEHELEALQRTLEQRIVDRTAELHDVVERLQREIVVREAAQGALQEEKERFHDTLSNASDAFVEVDAHERIVSWNRSAERIFGWPREQMMGRQLSQVLVPRPAGAPSGRLSPAACPRPRDTAG